MTIFEVTRKNSILRVLRIEVLKFYECRKINTKKLLHLCLFHSIVSLYFRRKKKCIRVQSYIKEENEAGEMNRTSNGSPSSNGTNNPMNNNDHKKSNQEDIKNIGRSVNSEGEDDEDLEDLDHDLNDDQSPGESRNGRESLESNSEQSVTSPAGLGSLPSLGSPASIASPSDPSSFESMSNIGLSHSNSSNWFSPPSQQQGSTATTGGAFKPPAPTSSAFQSAHQQFHPGHPYNAYYNLLQNPLYNMQKMPVGTDPRDAKNPLSISQLTGNAVGEVHGACHSPALACNGKEH